MWTSEELVRIMRLETAVEKSEREKKNKQIITQIDETEIYQKFADPYTGEELQFHIDKYLISEQPTDGTQRMYIPGTEKEVYLVKK